MASGKGTTKPNTTEKTSLSPSPGHQIRSSPLKPEGQFKAQEEATAGNAIADKETIMPFY